MIKKAFIYFLIFSLGTHCLGRLGILAHFYINKNYIVNYLCENKSKPQLHCDGKCYLAKKIKAAEDEEKKHTAQLIKVQEVQLFAHEIFHFSFKHFVQYFSSGKPAFYLLQRAEGFLSFIFQPPRF